MSILKKGAIVSLVLVGALLLMVVSIVPTAVSADSWEETRTFPLPTEGKTLWLDIDADVATFTIEGKDDIDEITVAIEVDGWDKEDVDITTRYDEGHLEVWVDVDTGLGNILDALQKLELTITVPTELQLTAMMDLGEINVDNVTIVNELDIQTSVARVHFNGTVGDGGHRIVSDVGEIKFNGTVSDGDLEIGSNVGDVSFEGTFGPQGGMEIWTDVGAITVYVTEDSAFYVDAQTALGHVDDKSVTLAEREKDRGFVGIEIKGIYGADAEPTASMDISTQVGDIEIIDFAP